MIKSIYGLSQISKYLTKKEFYRDTNSISLALYMDEKVGEIVMMLDELKWDSKIFNKKIAKLFINQDVDNIRDLSEAFVLATKDAKFRFRFDSVISKVPFESLIKMNELEKCGYRLKGINVAFERSIQEMENDVVIDPIDFSFVSNKDDISLDNLKKIAEDNFASGHFYNDDFYAKDSVKEFYSEWASNLFKLDNSLFIVVNYKSNHVGFVGYLVDDGLNLAHLELIAIKKEFQGKGLGKLLIQKSILSLHELGINKIKVNTHLENSSAINLYFSLGFRYLNSEAYFHLNFAKEYYE